MAFCHGRISHGFLKRFKETGPLPCGSSLSSSGYQKTGDYFIIAGLHFEGVDMDGNRIDKVLVMRIPAPASQ
jgi:hypothetical protein